MLIEWQRVGYRIALLFTSYLHLSRVVLRFPLTHKPNDCFFQVLPSYPLIPLSHLVYCNAPCVGKQLLPGPPTILDEQYCSP